MPKPTPKKLDPRTLVAMATKAAAVTRKNAEVILARAKRLESKADTALHAFGRALAALAAPTNYHALGYQSFDSLLGVHFTLKPRQADKLVVACPAYEKEIFDGLGIEKAAVLLTYVGLTEAADDAQDLAKRDVKIEGVPISQMSVSQLEAAVKRLRPKKKATPEERDANAAARRAQAKMRKKGMRSAEVRAVRAEGKWWLEARMPVGEEGALGLG